MRKFIIKSNEWYDNLEDSRRLMFFLFVIMGSFLISEYFFYIKNFIWSIPIWAFTLWIWRSSYTYFKWKDWYKKTHKK